MKKRVTKFDHLDKRQRTEVEVSGPADVDALARVETPPRLHPQSWQELRQLVNLHGVADIRAAIDAIEHGRR